MAATLPFLGRHVAAMVALQSLIGMRPGEVCRLSPSAVESGGGVWLYGPVTHKTAYRGKSRVVPLGPKAQAVLSPFFSAAADPDAPVFSPLAERSERNAARPAARKSVVQPSQRCRRVEAPRRAPGPRYLPAS